MSENKIRFYKGIYKVQILIKGRKQMKVWLLEPIPGITEKTMITIPRLLWRHQK